MEYKINVDVHRWKKDQIVSEKELLSEKVNIKDWLNNLLILNIKEEKKVKFDFDGDGDFDKDDLTIAGKAMATSKKKKKNKKGKW